MSQKVEVGEGLLAGFRSRGNRTKKKGRLPVSERLMLKNYRPPRVLRSWDQWTPEDDDKLTRAVLAWAEKKVDWSAMATNVLGGKFPAKEASLRWHTHLMAKLGKRGPWSPEETLLLIQCVKHFWSAEKAGPSSWPEVAMRLGTGRIHRHCQRQWQRKVVTAAARLGIQAKSVTPEILIDAATEAAAERAEQLLARSQQPEPEGDMDVL